MEPLPPEQLGAIADEIRTRGLCVVDNVIPPESLVRTQFMYAMLRALANAVVRCTVLAAGLPTYSPIINLATAGRGRRPALLR